MKVRLDPHAPYRELLAARLDRPLTRFEVRKLAAHLKGCAVCLHVDGDYRAQRGLLRTLPQPVPPRDLWARTSTALDRETARWQFRYPRLGRAARRRARSAPVGALATAVAALAVITALAVLQLPPAIQTLPPTEAARPTPFAVPPQPLAFVGTSSEDLAIYSTQVSQVCPTTAPDCFFDEGIVRTPVSFRSAIRPRNVAMSPSGQQLALVGYDLTDDVFAVVQMPSDSTAGPPAPGGVESATPAIPEPTANMQPSDAAQPTPADTAGDPPATTASVPGGSATTDPAATDSTLASGPPATAVPGLTVLAILEGVHSAGAAPAWSADGNVLAFSAMPSDGTHGPDVYVWQSGDAKARPITADHASFFASWAGDKVVASRVTGSAEDSEALVVATVAIDPATLEERLVDGPPMWLPAVNSQATNGVIWYGTLVWQDGLPVPQDGAFYMLDWTLVDPFAAGRPPASDPSPPIESTPSPESSVRAESTPAPGSSGSAGTSGSTASPAASSTPNPTVTTNPTAEPTPGATAEPTPAATLAVPDILKPIDSALGGLTDWQVRWSTDGMVFGVWVADAAGSSWGQLVVLAIDPATGQPAPDAPLLGPTFASRAFTLGLNRVAWVAPSDESPDGELRIRTWGSDGVGGLRVKPFDLEEVVPAF